MLRTNKTKILAKLVSLLRSDEINENKLKFEYLDRRSHCLKGYHNDSRDSVLPLVEGFQTMFRTFGDKDLCLRSDRRDKVFFKFHSGEMPTVEDKIELVRKNIKNYPDFPKPGILFRDVFSVLNNPDAAQALHDLLISHCTEHIPKIQAICALDSRGFLFGPLIANHFHIPFVPIRKKGKLPGNIKTVSYDLEYGSETFEIQSDALKPDSNVLLVDDLLATGGSLSAGCRLVSSIGSKVDHCLVVMELEELNGRKQIPCPVYSLIKL